MAGIELDTLDFEGMACLDDGIVNQMLRYHALRIARDCADRPAEKGKRVLTIIIESVPICSQKGELDHVETSIKMRSKSPEHRTKTFQMRADDARGLLFNPHFGTALDQRPLFPDALDVE